jgi:glycosyltransferase involved in cell wall biosynthesis
MSSTKPDSLRILFDLQACQTPGSAHRGVGRYSSSLFETVASLADQREVFALTSNDLPHSYEPQKINPARVIAASALPDWHSKRAYEGGDQDTLDGIMLAALCQDIKPDVIHISHPFEGFGDRVGVFDPAQRVEGQIVSATLYDLIPLLFQEHYFQNQQFRRWYYARVAWLRKADLLLAISESSRQDAIRLLGIEPWRIVTIHGGIADHFVPPVDRQQARNRLLQRFSLREKMVLYTGGDDHRKNIKGAIRAFAKLKADLRKNTLLVIVCTMQPERKQIYLDVARDHGLAKDDILITGFVEEQDLIDFYGVCDLFLFPSLYEGLGLPVLEAMACGAPVMGGNNSSIRELIVREDALFDAADDYDIAEHIRQVLTDKDFAADLRKYGQQRAAEFSWQQTAELALAAFDEALSRARYSGVESVQSGWLPRKRLAILSPLPPCQSGIADYNAQFLPFLARHFEIDLFVEGYVVSDEILSSQFRIFDSKDFAQVAASYDSILYEFGNSEFHAHMLPLLEKFPGVVGLHDAYLSGLFGYLDFHMGDTGSYAKEMLAAHGPQARRYFAPSEVCIDPIGGTMVELPCTKRVLDRALGVISHSVFNLDMARAHYPQGWLAPYRIIPQMVVLPNQTTDKERQAIREEFGFQPDDFLVVTFGHVAWTKWGDRLLDAFLNSLLRDQPKAHLLFVGALADDDFGQRLSKTIRKAGLGRRIQITGYQTTEDYNRYLQIADLALQLRTKSRGGTPKGVLDCLAYGVPVIVNNDASYTDYPDDVVIKLDPEPEIAAITEKLESLYAHPDQRTAYAKRGRQYVAEIHDPTQSAAAYAAALHEFSARERAGKDEQRADTLAPLIAGTAAPAAAAKEAAEWLNSRERPAWVRRRLYIDVSHIVQTDHETGIPRVVKEIVRALYTSQFAGFEPIAVELKEGDLYAAQDWLEAKGLLAPSELPCGSGSQIEFQRGDLLLMLDSSWARYSEFQPVFDRARQAHVPVITTVYDLLPITLPPEYVVEGGREWFEGWFCEAVDSSDGLLCISKAVASDVVAYVEEHCPKKESLKVGYWHLGANFDQSGSEGGIATHISDVKESPYLLVVGTIEPRKSHALIVETMERLWAQGVALNLCIAGKEGWLVDELMARIRSHPERGKQLFFYESPNDSEIAALYRDAAGLIFLSAGEGFGLPLVEAAHYGIPIICSDIPVFREIAGEYATYVTLDGPESVSKEILKWWELRELGKLPDTKNIPRLTWDESAEQLLEVVFEENWFWRK